MGEADKLKERWIYRGVRVSTKNAITFTYLDPTGEILCFPKAPNGKKGSAGWGQIGGTYEVDLLRPEGGGVMVWFPFKWLSGTTEKDERAPEWTIEAREAFNEVASHKKHKAITKVKPHLDPEIIEPLRRAYHNAPGQARDLTLAEIVAAVTNRPTKAERDKWRSRY